MNVGCPEKLSRLFRNPYVNVVLSVGVSIGLTLTLLWRTELMTYAHPDFSRPADHHKYIWMATHPIGSFHIAPFCWRLGLPIMVQVLPFEIQTSFLLITFLSVAGTGVLVREVARSIGHSNASALLAVLLYFSIPWGAKYQIYNFWLPDAPAMFFVTLSLYFMIQQKTILTGLSISLGVLIKETVIFVAPLVYTLQAHRVVDVAHLKKSAMLVLPAVILLVAVRVVIPARNHETSYLTSLPYTLWQVQKGTAEYNFLFLWESIAKQRIAQASIKEMYRWTIGSFGLLPIVLGILGILKNPALALRLSPFIVLASLQPLFAVNVQRLVVLASPALILLAIEGAQWLVRRAPWFSRTFLPIGFLLFLPNLIIYRRFVPGVEVYVLLFQIAIGGILVLTEYVFLIYQKSVNRIA